MMHGREKSDPGIVAMKPANKAGQPTCGANCGEPNAAESVEPRAGTKGNATSKRHAPDTAPDERATGAGPHTASQCRLDPRWEPDAGKLQVRICAGGTQ